MVVAELSVKSKHHCDDPKLVIFVSIGATFWQL